MATPVARNANEVKVAPMVGSDAVWSVESGGHICVCAFSRNLDSVAVNMSLHLIYLIEIFLFSIRFTKIMLK